MTQDDFRAIALALPEALEGAHMGHADFRVRGKIFASLGWPDADWGMVKLTPEEQALLVEAEHAPSSSRRTAPGGAGLPLRLAPWD